MPTTAPAKPLPSPVISASAGSGPDAAVIDRWRALGSPIPPPLELKQATLRAYARAFGLRAFVETGTFKGETTWALKDEFDSVVSVEVYKPLADEAKALFAGTPHVNIIEGDSAREMPSILAGLHQPALFWLDGHITPGGSKGKLKTPILIEIETILSHHIKGHVLVIDDARLFEGAHWPLHKRAETGLRRLLGRDAYPRLAAAIGLIRSLRPDMTVEVRMDSIRATPPRH